MRDDLNDPETASIDGGRRPDPVDGGPAAVDAGVVGIADGPDGAVPASPSDCTMIEGTCVQAYGAFHGTAFVCPDSPGHRFFVGTGEGEQTRLLVQLFSCAASLDILNAAVPTGRVGQFEYDLSMQEASSAGVELVSRDGAAKRTSLGSDMPGFVGRLVGSVSADKRVRGTLSGRWLGGCKAKTADTLCDDSWVLMTFNLPVL